MGEKGKAAISYFLTAAAFAVFGVDALVEVDLMQGYEIAVVVVGAVASAFGVFWTAPKRK
jgi:hypothetical protein